MIYLTYRFNQYEYQICDNVAQWDTGQVIKVSNLPRCCSYNIRYSNEEETITTKTKLIEDCIIHLPNECFFEPGVVHCYIQHEKDGETETIADVSIDVKERKIPSNVTPTDIRSGKYAVTSKGVVIGSLNENGIVDVVITDKDDVINIPSGIVEGGTVSLSEEERNNIRPEIIKEGEVVLGVEGKYSLGQIGYEGNAFVVPTKEQQTLNTKDKLVSENITVDAIPEEYIIPEGEIDIDKNGSYDVTETKQVNVNVQIPDGYIKPDGMMEIKENGEHDITEFSKVDVSVPIPKEYIKPEGSKYISENGNHDVAEFSEVEVDVQPPEGYIKPEGEILIEKNEVVDVTNVKFANVNVPLKYEEGFQDGYEASQDTIVLQEKTFEENGEFSADEGFIGFSKVNVEVPIKTEVLLNETITENGTFTYQPEEGTVWNGATITVHRDYMDGGTSDPVGILVQKTITENGEYEIVSDVEKALIEKVELTVDVPTGGDTEAIEQMIDNSGVLGSTKGTVEEKVEQLVDKAEDENLWYELSKYSKYMGTSLFREYKGTRIPRVDLSKTESMNYFCTLAQNLTSIDFYLNTENCVYAQQAFGSTPSLLYMKGINLQKCSNIASIFRESGLIKIEKSLNLSSVTNATYAFYNMPNLEFVRFVANTLKVSTHITSPKLSAASIRSIIDGLAYVETAQTLTLHKNIVLTDEQKATIYNKGWTLAQ